MVTSNNTAVPENLYIKVTLFSSLCFIHSSLSLSLWLHSCIALFGLCFLCFFTSSLSSFKISNTHFTKMSSPQAKSPSRLTALPPKRGQVKRRIFKAVANAVTSFGTGTKAASERKLKRTQTAGSFSSSSTYSSGCNSPRMIDDHSDWCIIAYNKLS